MNLPAAQLDLLHRARRGDLYVYPHSMTRPGDYLDKYALRCAFLALGM
ncbi:hypothetical protein [Nonomuraea sp. MG754425]|nr:hypothetical protein [Nonomuraea sp. MG754425]